MAERTERKKIIGILGGIGMNVNCVIGLGIFTAPGVVWKTLNAPLAMILWTLGGIISIAASLSYAALGASIRQSGGELVYVMHLGKVNSKLNQLSIFVSYIVSFLIIVVIQPGIIGAELQVATQYLLYTINNNPSELSELSTNFKAKLIAIITLAIITGYHIPSSRVANIINQTFAGIKLVILAIIAIAGLVKLPSVLKEHSNIWSSPFDDIKEFKSFSSAFDLVMFSYDGWNILNYSLDEFIDPKKNLIISNLSSAIIIIILYLLANVAFISVVPKELIFENDKHIVSYFFKELFGEKVGQILLFIVTLSAIGKAASLVFGGSRIIGCAADLDYIPFFSNKLKWNSKDESPKNALIAQFMWCSLLIILIKDGIGSDVYGSFLNFSWLGALIMYILTGVVLLYLRYKTKETEDFQLFRKDYYFLNILIWLFIVARIYELNFHYHFQVTCSESVFNCEEYMENESIKRRARAGFLVIAIICYFVIYLLREEDEDGDEDDDDY